jgi:hypothetical protein
MDEARAVLERLGRIEVTTDRAALIAELRELVREVEAWVRVEVPDAFGASRPVPPRPEASPATLAVPSNG